MKVIIKMGNVSAKVIDNEGDTVLDYKVENYEFDANLDKLSAAIFEMITTVRERMERDRD